VEDQVYERARVLQRHLEANCLNDLNPNGEELRSMMHVLTVGWGHKGEKKHVDVVENLLRRREIL
jgi:hypothetical protein